MIIKTMQDFDTEVKPKMKGFTFSYDSHQSEFANFGSYSGERVEFKNESKIGDVDFWETGWIQVTVYDLKLDETRIDYVFTTEAIEANPHFFDQILPLIID